MILEMLCRCCKKHCDIAKPGHWAVPCCTTCMHVREYPLFVSGDRKSMQIQISRADCLNPLLCCIRMRRLQMEIGLFSPTVAASDKRQEVLSRKFGFDHQTLWEYIFFWLGLSSGSYHKYVSVDLAALFHVL